MIVFDIIISYNFSGVNGFKKIFILPFFSFSVRAKNAVKSLILSDLRSTKPERKPSNFATNGKRFSTAVEFAEKMKKPVIKLT